jgi:hypothetical protein
MPPPAVQVICTQAASSDDPHAPDTSLTAGLQVCTHSIASYECVQLDRMNLTHTLAHAVSSAGKLKYVCFHASGACDAWQANNAILRADVQPYALATWIFCIPGFWYHLLTFNDVECRIAWCSCIRPSPATLLEPHIRLVIRSTRPTSHEHSVVCDSRIVVSSRTTLETSPLFWSFTVYERSTTARWSSCRDARLHQM